MVELIVNLFDNSWRQSACSVAWATSRHIQYVRDRTEFDGVSMFVDGFINWDIVDRVRSPVKIGWLHEPECLIPDIYTEAEANTHKFDFILTWSAELLEARPDAFRFSPYGGVWIDEAEWGMRSKTRLCSMLYGNKAATEGHRLRPVIADKVQRRGVEFFGARGVPTDYSPGTKLSALGDYAFSIVVEACRQDHLFTEILLDCFAVGTVPVFWGCPGIGEFFDPDGVLAFETAEGCAEIVDRLDFRMYDRLRPHVEENLRRVRDYPVTEDWIYDHWLRDYDYPGIPA